ncbi:phospholipase A2 precursor [Clonorchis sinensis]|uniref:Phospholipase A2 n=1 Tax=Clonorchis sinensis TaxID=79923 RepID=G7Y607_CLOSI|nr:phospholipase A2 precursor [Clonorchis sinensis]
MSSCSLDVAQCTWYCAYGACSDGGGCVALGMSAHWLPSFDQLRRVFLSKWFITCSVHVSPHLNLIPHPRTASGIPLFLSFIHECFIDRYKVFFNKLNTVVFMEHVLNAFIVCSHRSSIFPYQRPFIYLMKDSVLDIESRCYAIDYAYAYAPHFTLRARHKRNQTDAIDFLPVLATKVTSEQALNQRKQSGQVWKSAPMNLSFCLTLCILRLVSAVLVRNNISSMPTWNSRYLAKSNLTDGAQLMIWSLDTNQSINSHGDYSAPGDWIQLDVLKDSHPDEEVYLRLYLDERRFLRHCVLKPKDTGGPVPPETNYFLPESMLLRKNASSETISDRWSNIRNIVHSACSTACSTVDQKQARQWISAHSLEVLETLQTNRIDSDNTDIRN